MFYMSVKIFFNLANLGKFLKKVGFFISISFDISGQINFLPDFFCLDRIFEKSSSPDFLKNTLIVNLVTCILCLVYFLLYLKKVKV